MTIYILYMYNYFMCICMYICITSMYVYKLAEYLHERKQERKNSSPPVNIFYLHLFSRYSNLFFLFTCLSIFYFIYLIQYRKFKHIFHFFKNNPLRLVFFNTYEFLTHLLPLFSPIWFLLFLLQLPLLPLGNTFFVLSLFCCPILHLSLSLSLCYITILHRTSHLTSKVEYTSLNFSCKTLLHEFDLPPSHPHPSSLKILLLNKHLYLYSEGFHSHTILTFIFFYFVFFIFCCFVPFRFSYVYRFLCVFVVSFSLSFLFLFFFCFIFSFSFEVSIEKNV